MLIQQYMDDFNAVVGKDSFKFNLENQNFVRSQLEIIIPMFMSAGNIDSISKNIVDNFVRNLHKILNQSLSYSIDQLIVNSTLKFLANALTGHDNHIRSSILYEIKYPVFVSLLVSQNLSNNENGQLDVLRTIKETLKTEKIVDEHNLKLLIEVFKEFDSPSNVDEKIIRITAEILINLCLNQPSTKAHILRKIKATNFIKNLQKTNDNMMAFKYYILMENDAIHTDIIYFLKMSLKEILTCLKDLNFEPVSDSMNILEKMVSSQRWTEFNLIDDEGVSSQIEKLSSDLLSKMSYEKSYANVYSGKILQFLQRLLDMSPGTATLLDSFVNGTCQLESHVTSQFLEFLSTYVASQKNFKDTRGSITSFTMNFLKDLQNTENDFSLSVKSSFVLLLRNLHIKLKKIDELNYDLIFMFLKNTIDKFKTASLTKLNEKEFHHFIYVLDALNAFGSIATFKNLLDEIIEWPKLSVYVARCLLSENPEVVEMSTRLAVNERVNTRRIAEFLASSSVKRELDLKSDERSDSDPIRFNFTSYIRDKLSDDLDKTIKRINKTLENNDVTNLRISDVTELYRLKNEMLQGFYENAASKLEDVIAGNCELNKSIRKLTDISKSQDTMYWQLQVKNEQISNDNKTIDNSYRRLKQSLQIVTAKYEQECENNKQIEILKAAQAKEINLLTQAHEKQMRDKQDEIRKMEHALQEAEQMKATIMSLMAAKSFKK